MQVAPSLTPWSTVAALPDYLLLSQTRQLARHEQALQILVLDHLREIEARRLHLTRGNGSLFDYVVHELGYTAAAAWRRIKAMRLCSQTGGARELLQDGSLNLSNAAQLQNLFERSDRSRGRPPGSQGTDGGLDGEPRDCGTPGEPPTATPMRAGERDPAPPEAGPGPVAAPVLDAAAREELVRQAAGKSTREVQQMLAEVDPELAQPRDRLRALSGGRWELKAAVDAECRHGLEKLLMLLSHRDPHLTLGGLVERLVRDGLDRYDPARPPRVRRTGARRSGVAERSASAPARRDTGAVKRSVAGADGGGAERQSEVERDDALFPPAAANYLPGPSGPKRPAEAAHGETNSAAVRDIIRCSDSARKESAPVGSGDGYSASLATRHSVTGYRNASRGGGTEQRCAHHFVDEVPNRSPTRSQVACGGAERRRSGGFGGEAGHGGRARRHEVRAGAGHCPALRLGGEASHAGRGRACRGSSAPWFRRGLGAGTLSGDGARMRATESDARQRRLGCFAGEAARESRR